MNYLYQFDDAALDLVLRGLAKLPMEEALPLYQQIAQGAEEQRKSQPISQENSQEPA